MAKFMFVYRHETANFGKMPPEERQQHMQKWHVWIKEVSKKLGW